MLARTINLCALAAKVKLTYGSGRYSVELFNLLILEKYFNYSLDKIVDCVYNTHTGEIIRLFA